MTAIRTPAYRAASHRVLNWCGWYTRDLSPDVAGERRDEIASDLHEHAVWAEKTGVTPQRLRYDIILRAIRGIPHDLSWRSGQLRAGHGADPMPLGMRRAGDVLAALVVTGGVLVAGAALFLLIRVLRALVIGDVLEVPAGAVSVVIAAIFGGAGLVLSLRRRVRWLGAALLAPASVLIGVFAGDIVYHVSATGGLIVSRLSSHVAGLEPWWVVSVSIGVGAALGFIGAAVWWWPGGPQAIGEAAVAAMHGEQA
ncbi:hypothetical protein [Plantibacter sp. RU18]|uniref:hypothetical protein n=1 Tax=Plantibacter sp. RU18 TaxID=3158143 RepID=UPI003D36212A